MFLAWWLVWSGARCIVLNWPEIEGGVVLGFLAGTCVASWVAEHFGQRRAGRFVALFAVAGAAWCWSELPRWHAGRGALAAVLTAGSLSLLAAVIAVVCGEAPAAHRADLALTVAVLAALAPGVLRGRDLIDADWPAVTLAILSLAVAPPRSTRSASSATRST